MPVSSSIVVRVCLVVALVLTSVTSLVASPRVRAATIELITNDPADLIEAIEDANESDGPDTIVLLEGATYTLAEAYGDGNGLPKVTSEITILGNGATITRAEAASSFRIFRVEGAGNLWLEDVTISNGQAESGAGISIEGGGLTLVRSTVDGNTASSIGGGLHTRFAEITMEDSTLSNNNAQHGGGTYIVESTVTLTNSTVSRNSASVQGGGIWVSHNTLTLTNTTVSGNSGNYGAAIHQFNGVTTLTNSTISGNIASFGSGGVFRSLGVMQLENSIIAGNTSGGDPLDVVSTIVSLPGGHNLIGTGAMSGIVNGENGNQVGSADDPLDPRLGVLADNGGATQTMALQPDSPAINAGNDDVAPARDQRGVDRPQGGRSDIGAYELDDDSPPLITPNVSGTLGTNGWYTSSVEVSWTIEDDQSPVIGSIGCEPTLIDSDTPDQTVSCEATTIGGTSDESISVKVDMTPPDIIYSGNLGQYAPHESINITCTASDNISGVASDTCADIHVTAASLGPGKHMFSATATDLAGNVGGGSTTVIVGVTYEQLCTMTQQATRQASVAQSACSMLAIARQATASGNPVMASIAMLNYELQIRSAMSRRYISPRDGAELLAYAVTVS